MANLQGGLHLNCITRMMHFSLVLLFLGHIVCMIANGLTIDNTDAVNIAELQGQPALCMAGQLRHKEITRAAEELKSKQEAASRVKADREGEVEQLNLLEDTTARFTVKELRISGNTLISTEELLKTMPLVYNASNKPLQQANPAPVVCGGSCLCPPDYISPESKYEFKAQACDVGFRIVMPAK